MKYMARYWNMKKGGDGKSFWIIPIILFFITLCELTFNFFNFSCYLLQDIFISKNFLWSTRTVMVKKQQQKKAQLHESEVQPNQGY